MPTTSNLDFPNPLLRTDLPQPKRRWRYVVAGLLVFCVLGLLALPRIASSKIGRNALTMHLQNKFNAKVGMTGFKTSWRGPTTIYQFWMTDSEGRQVKFTQLDSPITLWQLLRGNFDLQDATVTDLHVDYVVDYGDGSDTLDRLPAGWRPGAVMDPNRAAPPVELPELAGRITLTNATLVLTRAQVAGEKRFTKVFRSVRFTKIDGTLDIAALDEPFEIDVEGELGGEDGSGTFSVAGKLDLGDGGSMTPAKLGGDLKVKLENLPNATTAGSASLGWILVPLLPPEDYTTMFGPVIRKVDAAIALGGGKMTFTHLDVRGKTKDGRETFFTGQPLLDLTTRPRSLGLAGPTKARVELTRTVARHLAYVNPFLNDLADKSTGTVHLQLDELSLPVAGNQKQMKAKGSLRVTGATLASGPMTSADLVPPDLTTQWQSLVGSTSSAVPLEMPQPLPFEIGKGQAKPADTLFLLEGLGVSLDGQVGLDGQLAIEMSAALPPRMHAISQCVTVPVAGTLKSPKPEVPTTPPAYASAYTTHLGALKERKIESLLQRSSQQVEQMLHAIDRLHPDGTVAGEKKTPPRGD